MRILVAEDDPVLSLFLKGMLTKWGYEVDVTNQGEEAWRMLQEEDSPRIVLLDWLMPGLDGVEICRKVRALPASSLFYLILLTSKNKKAEIVEGLQAGANDYVTKPFDNDELRARVQVGAQIIQLQFELARRVKELQDALSRVKALEGMLPICSYCKKIRDDRNYWHQVESYITAHSEAVFSHSICPLCFQEMFGKDFPDMVSTQSPDTPSSDS